MESYSDLFQTVDALGCGRFFSGGIQSGKQKSGEDCNDGDYYKEFYKSEMISFHEENTSLCYGLVGFFSGLVCICL